ncbi:MAG: hypothetical protein A3G35_19155 [candidate division NC10 bacterium RIFCSPLOWO2_12_FULL_66_18]|nr:MAG: hypothetical protein A3G35_19155 [candidate division NC10 bacterium RIFCSPLOWO2_12_FULL_66_18]
MSPTHPPAFSSFLFAQVRQGLWAFEDPEVADGISGDPDGASDPLCHPQGFQASDADRPPAVSRDDLERLFRDAMQSW